MLDGNAETVGSFYDMPLSFHLLFLDSVSEVFQRPCFFTDGALQCVIGDAVDVGDAYVGPVSTSFLTFGFLTLGFVSLIFNILYL